MSDFVVHKSSQIEHIGMSRILLFLLTETIPFCSYYPLSGTFLYLTMTNFKERVRSNLKCVTRNKHSTLCRLSSSKWLQKILYFYILRSFCKAISMQNSVVKMNERTTIWCTTDEIAHFPPPKKPTSLAIHDTHGHILNAHLPTKNNHWHYDENSPCSFHDVMK